MAPQDFVRTAPTPIARPTRNSPKKLKLLREGAGLTQAELGAHLGRSKSTVSRWERGLKTPGREAWQKFLAFTAKTQEKLKKDESAFSGPPPDYPEDLKRFRANMGLSQEQLAALIGVTMLTVGRWERQEVCPSALAWRQYLAAKKTAQNGLEKGKEEGRVPRDYSSKIRAFRKSEGLTQAKLAARSRVGLTTVQRWERGTGGTPSLLTWQKFLAFAQEPVQGPPPDYPEALKRFRANMDLTQEQLAALIGVSSGTVSAWECGNVRPSPLCWNQYLALKRKARAGSSDWQAMRVFDYDRSSLTTY